MAGHSHAKNVMRRKNSQNAKKGKVFTKVARAITVAAKKGGFDVETNFKLKDALRLAKIANLPKENIERAIEKAKNADKDNLEEMLYEGYGPEGVAILVEVCSDNRNRITSEIRAAFSKYGGNLGEINSVKFMFEHNGFVRCRVEPEREDEFLSQSIELGAIEVEEPNIGIFKAENFSQAQYILEQKFEIEESILGFFPTHKTEGNEKFYKLIEALENNEDIQAVWHNADI